MKHKFGLLSLALLLLGSLVFGSEQMAAGFASILPGYISAPKIPDNVLYESIFRLDVTFQRQAEEQELAGEPVTPLINYFKEQFNLTDTEAEQVHRIAREFAEAVGPTDKQASNIIDGIRKRFPNGRVEPGQEVPPPPPELTELQRQRDSIVLDHRDELINSLGSEKFALVDDVVKTNFAKNFASIQQIADTRRGQ